MPRGRIANQLAHGRAEGLSVGAFGQLLVVAPRMQLGIEQRGLIDGLRDEGFLEERCARDPIKSPSRALPEFVGRQHVGERSNGGQIAQQSERQQRVRCG